MIRLYLLLFLSISVLSTSYAFEVPAQVASDTERPFCNGRRVFGGAEKIAQMNPRYASICYPYVRGIIRKATRHNYHLKDAEGVIETLLILSPRSAYPRISSAELEIKKRQLKLPAKPLYEILREVQAASKIKPPIADAFIALGKVNVLMGCLVCADMAAERAVELEADSPTLALLLASIEEERNNLANARTILTNALASDSVLTTPEISMEMQLKLSFLHAMEKDYTEAARGYDKAIEMDPGNPAPYLAHAQLLLLIGNAEAARNAARKSNRVAASVAAIRLQSFAEYLSWAEAYLQGDESADLKRLLRTAFVSPEEAFVESARYEATSGITEALLQAQVIRDIETRDGQGNTAFMMACLGNNIKLVNILMAQKSNLNAQNSKGERALGYLVSNRNYDATLALLRTNVEVNYIDVNGMSPLALAVFRNDKLLVRELIEHGASIQTVVKYAEGLGMTGIEEIIESVLPVGA